MIHEDACFRVLEQFQIQANLCGIGTPLKIDVTMKWGCSSTFSMGLKTLYTALLVLAMEQPLPAINALPKAFLNPTESRIFMLHGYMTS